MVRLPSYPKKHRGYILRSHAIWWLYTSKMVPNGYVLHHIDRNRLNDQIENLQLMTIGEHVSIHRSVELIDVVCKTCGKIMSVLPCKSHKQYCNRSCSAKSRVGDKSPLKGKKQSSECVARRVEGIRRAHAEGRYPVKIKKSKPEKKVFVSKRVVVVCVICNSEFLVYPYRKNQAKYCSSECKGVAFGLSRKGKHSGGRKKK